MPFGIFQCKHAYLNYPWPLDNRFFRLIARVELVNLHQNIWCYFLIIGKTILNLQQFERKELPLAFSTHKAVAIVRLTT